MTEVLVPDPIQVGSPDVLGEGRYVFQMALDASSQPVAIVTGGGRGIGKAIATSLVGDRYQVVITGRDGEQLAATAELLGADSIVSDVTEPGSAAAVVDEVVARYGRLDVVVNNAGTAGAGGPILSNTIEAWWDVLAVNLYGPMAFIHAALQHMVARRHGTIFNIGSYGAIRPVPGNSPYAVSKAALARLTDSVAAEVEADGVTILCVSPGLVATDMSREVPVFQNLPPEAWDRIEQIGNLVVELLGRSNLHELTGRFIHVRDDLDELLESTERIQTEGLYQLRMDSLDGRID